MLILLNKIICFIRFAYGVFFCFAIKITTTCFIIHVQLFYMVNFTITLYP